MLDHDKANKNSSQEYQHCWGSMQEIEYNICRARLVVIQARLVRTRCIFICEEEYLADEEAKVEKENQAKVHVNSGPYGGSKKQFDEDSNVYNCTKNPN